jgi:hypothetical protein
MIAVKWICVALFQNSFSLMSTTEKFFHEKIVLQKGKGLVYEFVEMHGWSNWGLQYQLGQVFQEGQVHKIREQILSTCLTTLEVLKNLRRFLQKRVWSRYSRNSRASVIYLQIFMQNGKEGEGEVFSKENIFIALFE